MQLEIGDILDSCRWFAGIQGASRQRLVAMAQRRSYAKGRMIFRQDDPCPGIFIVGTGLVRVFKTAPSGKEHVLHLIAPGSVFAEVAAIGGFPCPAFAEAVEATTCVLLPADPFNRALREDHALCLELLKAMTYWVRHFNALIEDIVLRDAAGRVARYLLERRDDPQGTISLPSLKKHPASHLNLTSETLSRTLRRLIDLELLEETAGKGLRVRDAAQLEEVAQGLTPLL